MVASLTSDNVVRSTIENNMADALHENDVKVIKSVDEFPPKIIKDSIRTETIIERARNKGAGAILTVTLQKKGTETMYVPGNNYIYSPLARYSYYDSFGMYYSFWRPYYYDPGYYTVEQVYFFETNLFDAKTGKLIWSAQSKTYDPGSLQSFSKSLAKTVVNKLQNDGLLK